MIYTVRPLLNLARQSLVEFRVVLEKKVTAVDVRWADLVVLVRNAGARTAYVLEEARACNITTIYDLDDNLWEIPPDSPSRKRHSPEQMRRRELYLAVVDLVKVYNPIVGEVVGRNFNSSIYLALAGIDANFANPSLPHCNDKKIRIVYATNRGASDPLWRLIESDLHKVLVERGPGVELTVWQEAPELLSDLKNVRVLPAEMDYEAYMQHLTSEGYDIGLAPLFDTVFYNSKTNTKFRDYGIGRIAGIYSNTPVYADVKDGVTGLIVGDSPGDWYQGISRLADDNNLRKAIQGAAFRFVSENYSQEKMEAQWMDVLSLLKLSDRAKIASRDQSGNRVRKSQVSSSFESINGKIIRLEGFDEEVLGIDPSENTFPRRFGLFGLTYRLRISKKNWDSLTVRFGTYQHTFRGKVEVNIREGGLFKSVLRSLSIEGSMIQDNGFLALHFPPIESLSGKEAIVHFRARGEGILPLLALYELGEVKLTMSKLDYIDWHGGQLNCSLGFSSPEEKEAE